MNEIKKLVRIVTNRVKKNVSLVDVVNNDDHPGKEQLLFNNIQSGLYDSDDDAARGIRGRSSRLALLGLWFGHAGSERK